MHIAELAVMNIKFEQSKAMMALMQSVVLTREQKLHVIELLKPIDDAINEASSSFIVE